MKKLHFLIFIAFTACAPYRVVETGTVSNSAKGKHYKTFTFGHIKYDSLTNENREGLTQLVEREMKSRGFKKDDANPDIVIVLRTADFQRNAYYRVVPPASTDISYTVRTYPTSSYSEEVMVLQFVDWEKMKIVWEASTAAVISKEPELTEVRMMSAVKELYKKFPL